MLQSEVVSSMTRELRERLPIVPDQPHVLLIQNDLPGRAALALLWQSRQNLTIKLVTDEPCRRDIVGFSSALTSVRNPPRVELCSHRDISQDPQNGSTLVWGLVPDDALWSRNGHRNSFSEQVCFAPFLSPFDSLYGRYIDQTKLEHELLLRDIIHEHAIFLNFSGDRFNPKDLYERTEHPRFVSLPDDFRGAVPALQRTSLDDEYNVVKSDIFDGTLKLDPTLVRAHYRQFVELKPIFEAFQANSFNVSVKLENDYVNPKGTGSLEIQVHLNSRLIYSHDVAEMSQDVAHTFSRLDGASDLRVSLVSHKNYMRHSWSKASETRIKVAIKTQEEPPFRSALRTIKEWFVGPTKRQANNEESDV